MDNCIFCQIAEGKSPATVHFEDEKVIVIDDTHPQAPVHMMVISKKHIGEFLDAGDALVNHMFMVVKKMIREQKIIGYRIVNNGKGAAFVDHLHIHVMGGIEKERGL